MNERKSAIVKMKPVKFFNVKNDANEIESFNFIERFPQLESSNLLSLCEDMNSFLRAKHINQNLQLPSIRQAAGSLVKFLIFAEENRILDPLDFKLIDHFRKQIIDDARQGKLSLQSIQITLRHLKGFIHFISDNKMEYPDWIFSSPRLPIHQKRRELEKAIYNNFDLDLLFKCKVFLNKRNQAMIELVVLCGLRASEITNLKIDSIVRHQNNGYIEFDSYRNGQEKIFYPSKHVMNTLNTYISEDRNNQYRMKISDHKFLFTNRTGRKMDSRVLSEILNKANLELKGLQKNITFSISNLRHTFTTKMVNEMFKQGNDIKLIEKVTGMKPRQLMTKYYIQANK